MANAPGPLPPPSTPWIDTGGNVSAFPNTNFTGHGKPMTGTVVPVGGGQAQPGQTQPGTPSLSFRQYFLTLDAVVRGLQGFFAAATFAKLTAPTAPGSLIAAADDAAAAAAGVPIGGFYRSPTTGAPPNTISTVRIRVT